MRLSEKPKPEERHVSGSIQLGEPLFKGEACLIGKVSGGMIALAHSSADVLETGDHLLKGSGDYDGLRIMIQPRGSFVAGVIKQDIGGAVDQRRCGCSGRLWPNISPPTGDGRGGTGLRGVSDGLHFLIALGWPHKLVLQLFSTLTTVPARHPGTARGLSIRTSAL